MYSEVCVCVCVCVCLFWLKNKSLYDSPAVVCPLLLDWTPAPATLLCLLTVLLAYLCRPYFSPLVQKWDRHPLCPLHCMLL